MSLASRAASESDGLRARTRRSRNSRMPCPAFFRSGGRLGEDRMRAHQMIDPPPPAADCPPSFSQRPGSIAEKYGPQTPGTKRGSAVEAMMQAEVPMI